MSRFERKYTWKHLILIVLLFVVAGGVNLISHSQIQTSACGVNNSVTQTVRKTTQGWPLTYSTLKEPVRICLMYQKGKAPSLLLPQSERQLNVWALIANEVLIIAVIGGFLGGISSLARKRGIRA